MSKPQIHWRLRRAARETELIRDPDFNYYIRTKPGIKVTKWHRLARLKGREEVRAWLRAMYEHTVSQLGGIIISPKFNLK